MMLKRVEAIVGAMERLCDDWDDLVPEQYQETPANDDPIHRAWFETTDSMCEALADVEYLEFRLREKARSPETASTPRADRRSAPKTPPTG